MSPRYKQTGPNLLDMADRPEEGTWSPAEPPSLRGVDTVYVDFETTGLDWWDKAKPVGAAVKPKGQPSRYLSWGHRGGGNMDEGAARRYFHDEFRGKRIVNIKTGFDLHESRAWGEDLTEDWRENTFHDVAFDAALLDDHRRRFNLNELAEDALGIGKIDLLIHDKGNIADLHASQVDKYACRDTDLVEGLDIHYRPLLEAEGLMPVRQLEDDVLPAVIEMERNGSLIDRPLLEQWEARSKTELSDAQYGLMQEAGFACNPSSGPDMMRLFRAHSLPVLHKCRKKLCGAIQAEEGLCRECEEDDVSPCFAAEVLSRYADADRAVELALQSVRLASLRSKFLVRYLEDLDANNIIRYALHQLRSVKDDGGGVGAVSGRFSSAGLTRTFGINIQQVIDAKKLKKSGLSAYPIRQLFIAPPGMRFLSVDASNIEYRVFAHYGAGAEILARFAADPWVNFHDIVLAMLQTVLPDFTYGDAKAVNFAKLFGAGLKKFAKMLGLTVQQARHLNRLYEETFPEAKAVMDLAMQTAEQRGWVKTLHGRRARFPDRQRMHSALNRVIQGTAADYNKMTLVDLYRQRRALGLTMTATVHDEAIGYLQTLDAQIARELSRLFNRQRMPMKVPILWSGEAGNNWHDLKPIDGWKEAAFA